MGTFCDFLYNVFLFNDILGLRASPIADLADALALGCRELGGGGGVQQGLSLLAEHG